MQVSVIITCHNYARYLSRAIRSAINQTLDKKDYEIIVVNDGSTDETKKVMESFAGFIKPLHMKKNVGLAASRNEGIKKAIGRYIVNLDADDYMDDNLLLVESLFLNLNAKWVGVSCDYFLVDENENHIERISGKKKPIACGVMMRTDRLFEIGLYDEKFKMREEEDLRIRLEEKHKIYNIELPLYRYRQHDNNMTNNKKKMEEFKKFLHTKHKKKIKK
ncbi:MAG TPA: glycosyltransferase family A protein [Ignavibacteria bacterium]|nr:glycosyltransferase family A protein [Ignavibacteria bacterium]